MKRIIGLTALFTAALFLGACVGCKTVAPLPVWAPNSSVAVAGEAIASANAAVVQYEKDVQAGFTPTVALNNVMSDIQQALTIAQPAFNAWEAAVRANPSATEPTALPSALTRISTDLAKLPSTAGGTQ